MENRQVSAIMMNQLEESVKLCGLGATREQLTKLDSHVRLVHKWNQKINLTGAASPKEIFQAHTLDSAFASSVGESISPGGSALDIGSGAGFPGIPSAILFPNTHHILMEPRNKRASFLERADKEKYLDELDAFVSAAGRQTGSNPI